MTKFQFNVNTDTTVVDEFVFRGQQAARAAATGATRAFEFRDIRGNVGALPKYITAAIAAAGYRPVYLGGTTYQYSVIGLVPAAE